MKAREQAQSIERAKAAALEVLRQNMHGPFHGLPRTAGWGYPEPYTRDLMISGLGVLVSGDKALIASLRRVLERLAANQSPHGHIPSLVHDAKDRGASDTTPLFLMVLAMYRQAEQEPDFLAEAAEKALTWMEYQSPGDRVMVAQLPTSDWRDEQWVLGFGLFVNAVVYGYLRLFGLREQARMLLSVMGRLAIEAEVMHRHVHEGLVLRHKPYYALWSYKLYRSERFDLLGNSIAILSGLASRSRGRAIVGWVEAECRALKARGELAVDLPPNLFPFIRPEDPDWRGRYVKYNQPGEYHNGGIWPFVCGLYVAACVAAGKMRVARRKLAALTELVRPARVAKVDYGFNEWFRAQDGAPCGQDWQSWSAATYLYAAASVEQQRAPLFGDVPDSPATGSGGRLPTE